jgi:glycopeptide antibiotics resistance protein
MEPVKRIDARAAAVTAVMLLVILYGSLYRFDIQPDLALGDAVRHLLQSWDRLTRPSDVIANVLLYVPLGFFFARTFRFLPAKVVVPFTVAFGGILSVAMELVQYHIRYRHSALSDVYSDTFGALLGACAGVLVRAAPARFIRWKWDTFALLLLVSWMGSRLYPYVPVIDLHKYWDAIKPLVLAPRLDATNTFSHLAAWLGVAMLLEAVIGVRNSRFALPALFALLTAARVFIAEIVLAPPEIIGGLGAVLLWNAALSFTPHRTVFVAAIFAATVVLQALEPFQFLERPRRFSWIPFRSLMGGSLRIAVVAFLEKVFAYGCLVWLLIRCGWPWLRATAAGAVLVLLLRLAQMYLPGRSAEVTDVLILIIMAGIMRLTADSPIHTPET